MGSRNRRLDLERLEGRVALSAGGMSPVDKPHHVALNGEVGGSFTFSPSNPDIGHSQTLTGSGMVSPLGQVSAMGTLTATGFIAKGHATGSFTLSNANGSVTIELTGPRQSGFSTLPRRFSFRVVGATGNYVGASDKGTATLFEAEADGIAPSPMSGASIIVGPIFGLTLRSS